MEGSRKRERDADGAETEKRERRRSGVETGGRKESGGGRKRGFLQPEERHTVTARGKRYRQTLWESRYVKERNMTCRQAREAVSSFDSRLRSCVVDGHGLCLAEKSLQERRSR
ncbi:hypothetical protein TGPRC2_426240 [Toxoplasma gondii TgCatPRC2]|uniref:Uncharacterized protein n=1 Tax=Toxoplasma gondii TgCatPRC2 TaxID=1130821 RepID=A0A151H666_TOXGO|nr:hypothetical protein TGPRC2_426240 [Toxoplasma gondii TgCatPRC2]